MKEPKRKDTKGIAVDSDRTRSSMAYCVPRDDVITSVAEGGAGIFSEKKDKNSIFT